MGGGCLPYQMGLEDGNGMGRRLESPFYLAGLYNSLDVEMGGLHESGDRREATLLSLTSSVLRD